MPAVDFGPRTWPQWQARLDAWAKAPSGRVRLSTPGRTRQGRPIPLLTLAGREKDAPEVLLVTGVHPREQSPPLVVGQLLDELLTEPPLPVTLHWLPMLNLDGKLLDEGEKDVRKNAAGVDLNRNFPLRWGGGRQFDPAWSSSTDSPRGNIYEGPAPLSEPESRALLGFIASRPRLRAMLDIHNPLREILWPAHTLASEYEHFSRIARGMQARQKDPYSLTKATPGSEPPEGTRTGSSGLSYTSAYYLHGVFSFNFELSTPDRERGKRGRYPSARALEIEWERNIREPLRFFLDAAATLPPARRIARRLSGSGSVVGEVRPGEPFGLLPPTSAPEWDWAVLTCAFPEIVVTSEVRLAPGERPFTLEVAKSARRGARIELLLTLWDRDRRKSEHRLRVTVA